MSTLKKHPVTHIESVQLANFFIRTLWQTTAAVIALIVRIPTSIILAIARRTQRNRNNW